MINKPSKQGLGLVYKIVILTQIDESLKLVAIDQLSAQFDFNCNYRNLFRLLSCSWYNGCICYLNGSYIKCSLVYKQITVRVSTFLCA